MKCGLQSETDLDRHLRVSMMQIFEGVRRMIGLCDGQLGPVDLTEWSLLPE